MSDVTTPMAIERRLKQLGVELDEANQQLADAELNYMTSKATYEVHSAAERMNIKRRASEAGLKVTIAEVEDEAILACQDDMANYYTSEAIVRAARSNISRVKTQVDIARSIGTSVRVSMDLS